MKLSLLALSTLAILSTSSATEAKKKKPSKNSKSSPKDKPTSLLAFPGIEGKIVGGNQVSSPDDYPYFVDVNGCGGSLIAPDVVLTAAHCNDNSLTSVRVGTYNTNNNSQRGQLVSIKKKTEHPSYNPNTVDYDFMLLFLESSVNVPLMPIVNDQSSVPSNGEMLTVIGLGATSEGGNGASILREVNVPTVSFADCNDQNSYQGDINDATMICAGFSQGGKDSCQGDSGGPLVTQGGVQVGVVSWGDGCARPDLPGVYARVSVAFDWIVSQACPGTGPFCSGSEGGGGPSPTPAPGTGGGGGGGCGRNELEFEFSLTTDDFGEDTSWKLLDGRGRTINSGSSYGNGQTIRTLECLLADDCYTLDVRDSYGDGLSTSNNAGYTVIVDGSQVAKVTSSQDSWSRKEHSFGSCSGTGGGGGGGSNSCMSFEVSLTTDDYPEDSAFYLIQDDEDIWWDKGYNFQGAYQTYKESESCLDPSSCYTFEMVDEWGDGITGRDGGVTLKVDGQVVYGPDGDFGSGFFVDFGAC